LLIAIILCPCLQSRAQTAPQAEANDSILNEVYSTALARAFFEKNDFKGAFKTYQQADTAHMAVRDLVNYAMAAFFEQQYERVLTVARYGLLRSPGRADFCRLAFFSSTELARYDEAIVYAEDLFSQNDSSQLHYYDYAYYVRLCQAQPSVNALGRSHLIASYQYLIRYYLYEKRDCTTAWRYAQRLQTIDPNNPLLKEVE
jgi:tetratricopeptide (TPR) repeat protein